MPFVPSEAPAFEGGKAPPNCHTDSFSRRVSDTVSADALRPWFVLPPQFTKSVLEIIPDIRATIGHSLEDAAYFHWASEYEMGIVSSLFQGDALSRNFRFFVDDGKYYGFYRFSHPTESCDGPEGYLRELIGRDDWWMHVSTHLAFHSQTNSGFRPLAVPDALFYLTVRHEMDHLVRHILSILRNYRNSGQFVSACLNPFERRKAELHAFYHQANFSIRLKWSGFPISWDEILDHHTGWSHVLGETPEDYRGVVEHVRSIIASRNALYNALCAKFWRNANPRNDYCAISSEGQHVFERFCASLPVGFERISDDAEMHGFLSYLWSLGRGISETPSWADEFLRRVFNPPAKVAVFPSYAAFRTALFD